MQELEKILEEIDQEVKEYMEIDFGDEYNAGIKDMAKMAEKIIRKHMNDGWISVEEQLPEDDVDIHCREEVSERMNKIKLKPCHFCGGGAAIGRHGDNYFAECCKCGS